MNAERWKPACCIAIALAASSNVASSAQSGAVQAGSYPDRPIRLIVPNGAGGSTDIVARVLAQKMAAALNQQIVVDNRGGAGGVIGTELVARAAPDGYTFLMHSVAYSVNPSLYTKAGYEIGKDLTGVAMAAVSPNIIYVHPSVKANTLKELLELAKTDCPMTCPHGRPVVLRYSVKDIQKAFKRI